MLLSLTVILVVILGAVALLPAKNRQLEQLKQATPTNLFSVDTKPPEVPTVSLRQQQIEEEAAAVAAEYQRRADAVWLEDVRGKASKLLGNTTSPANSKAKSE